MIFMSSENNPFDGARAAQGADATVGHMQVFNFQHRLPPPNMRR